MGARLSRADGARLSRDDGAADGRRRPAEGAGGGRTGRGEGTGRRALPRQTFPHQTFLKVPVAQRAPPDVGPPPFR